MTVANRIRVVAGILSFLIGVCLLLQRPLARRVAMVLLAIGVAFVVVISSVAISSDTFAVIWFDTPLVGATRRLFAAVVTLFFLLLYGGMFWMLGKADVRAAFDRRELSAG